MCVCMCACVWRGEGEGGKCLYTACSSPYLYIVYTSFNEFENILFKSFA